MKIIYLPDSPAAAPLTIPDSAIALPHRPVFLPDFPGAPQWSAHIVAAYTIGRLGKAIGARFAPRYIGSATLSVLLTADPCEPRDIPPFSFDNAYIPGEVALEVEAPVDATLSLDGEPLAHLEMPSMPSVAEALERLSRYITFKTGDIVALPTPVNVPLSPGRLMLTTAADERPLISRRIIPPPPAH